MPQSAIWLRPLALLRGAVAVAGVGNGSALPLAGGPTAFTFVEVLALQDHRPHSAVVPVAALRRWAEQAPSVADRLAKLTAPRAPWAGLALDRRSSWASSRYARQLSRMAATSSTGGARSPMEGRCWRPAPTSSTSAASSTRPGATPVEPADELARVEPVVAALAAAAPPVSIDTRHAAVMAGAVAKGARIVNDVSALTGDPASRAVVAALGAAVVLMHMLGEPRTMQQNPTYDSAPVEIADYLAARLADCAASGIARERIVVDPGIGFGKDRGHNLELLERIAMLHGLGCGILLGVSRKSMIGRVTNSVAAKDRLPGSLAAELHGIGQGVQIVRVHDVAETRQAIAVWQAITEAA